MELLDLQNWEDLESNFLVCKILDFNNYHMLSYGRFPNFITHTKREVSMVDTAYLCEQFIPKMKHVKSTSWDKLLNHHSSDVFFRLSSSLNPDIIAHSAGAVEFTDYLSAGGYLRPKECPRYDTKLSDSEVPIMLELSGMWSTPSMSPLSGPLWLGVIATDRVLSIGCPVGWGCRMHRLHLCRELRPHDHHQTSVLDM